MNIFIRKIKLGELVNKWLVENRIYGKKEKFGYFKYSKVKYKSFECKMEFKNNLFIQFLNIIPNLNTFSQNKINYIP